MKTGYFKRLWRLSRSNHGFRRSSTYQVAFACNATHPTGTTTTLQNKTRKIPKTNKQKTTIPYYGIPEVPKFWVDQENSCCGTGATARWRAETQRARHPKGSSPQLLGLLGVRAARRSVRLLTASVEKWCWYKSHNCVLQSGGTEATQPKIYRSSCEQVMKIKQDKPVLCWISNKMCQALLSPKGALVLLVFGEKNKTNNRKRDYCLWTEEFILLWN